jgi:hypothetical protein
MSVKEYVEGYAEWQTTKSDELDKQLWEAWCSFTEAQRDEATELLGFT